MSERPRDRAGACWRFIVDLYGRRGVAEACLSLQDRFRADIPLVLFLAWLAADRHVAIDARHVHTLVALVAAWQRNVVTELRRIRRTLKQSTWMDRPGVANFRAAVKDLELQGERLELDALSEWFEREATNLTGGGSIERNLLVYLEAITPETAPADRREAIRPIVEACGARGDPG